MRKTRSEKSGFCFGIIYFGNLRGECKFWSNGPSLGSLRGKYQQRQRILNMVKKIIHIGIFLGYIFLTSDLYAQNSFANGYFNYKGKTEEAINTFGRRENKNQWPKKLNLKIAPYYYLEYNSENPITNSSIVEHLFLDTVNLYALILRSKEILGWVNKSETPYQINFNEDEDSVTIKYSAEPRLIQLAETKSNIYFFVRFFHEVDGYKSFIAYLDQNNIVKFIDSDAKIYSYTEIITKEYGSFNKFLEKINFKELRHNLFKKLIESEDTITKIQNSIRFLKNDYYEIADHFSQDTLRVLSTFISHIKSIIPLNFYQKDKLESKIIEVVKETGLESCSSTEISFYRKDITQIVMSVLTGEEYLKYKQINRALQSVSLAANDFLYFYFLHKNVKPGHPHDEKAYEKAALLKEKAIWEN